MKKIYLESSKFLVVGIMAVLTDMSVYYLIYDRLGHGGAKAFSFICGTIIAFFLNKYWTFGKKQRSGVEVLKFVTLYSSTLGANVIVNSMSLTLFPQLIFLAFMAATGTSTVLNFAGQKLWVFK